MWLRLIYIADQIEMMAAKRADGECRGAGVTNRELYYICLKVAKTEAEVKKAMKKLASLLHVPKRALNIQKSRDGGIFGNLVLDYGPGEVFDCRNTRAHPDGYPVPQKLAEIIFGIESPEYPPRVSIGADVALVVVMEAGGIANRFIEDKTWEKHPVVFIHTGGHTSDDTNVFINIMSMGFGLPVWYIVDSDKGGLEVMNTPHHSGNRRDGCKYEYLFSGIETNLLGICAQDYERLEVMGDEWKIEEKKMSAEYKAEIEMLEEKSGLYDHGNVKEKKAHVKAMKKHGYKVQCEWVATDEFWKYFEERLKKIIGDGKQAAKKQRVH